MEKSDIVLLFAYFFSSLFLVDMDHWFIVFVSDEKSSQNKNKQSVLFKAAATVSKMATSFRFDLFLLICCLFLSFILFLSMSQLAFNSIRKNPYPFRKKNIYEF